MPRRWQRRGARSTGNLSSMSFAPGWRSFARSRPRASNDTSDAYDLRRLHLSSFVSFSKLDSKRSVFRRALLEDDVHRNGL